MVEDYSAETGKQVAAAQDHVRCPGEGIDGADRADVEDLHCEAWVMCRGRIGSHQVGR